MIVTPRNAGLQTQSLQVAKVQVANDTTVVTNGDQDKPTDLKSLPSYQSVLELGYASDLIDKIVHQLVRQGSYYIFHNLYLNVW